MLSDQAFLQSPPARPLAPATSGDIFLCPHTSTTLLQPHSQLPGQLISEISLHFFQDYVNGIMQLTLCFSRASFAQQNHFEVQPRRVSQFVSFYC